MKLLISILSFVVVALSSQSFGVEITLEAVTAAIEKSERMVETPNDLQIRNAISKAKSIDEPINHLLSAIYILSKTGDISKLECVWWQQDNPIARITALSLLSSQVDVANEHFIFFEAQAQRFRDSEALERKSEIKFLRQNFRSIRRMIDQKTAK
jgi:hypothetical protein